MCALVIGYFSESIGCIFIIDLNILFLLEEISDLGEELDISGSRWCGNLFFLRKSSIHRLHDEEYTECYDHEVECNLEEVTIVDGNRFLSLDDGGKGYLEICEVHIPDEPSDRWHDDVFHERGHNLAKCGTDNHTDSEIYYIALHSEVSELFEYTHNRIDKKINTG